MSLTGIAGPVKMNDLCLDLLAVVVRLLWELDWIPQARQKSWHVQEHLY